MRKAVKGFSTVLMFGLSAGLSIWTTGCSKATDQKVNASPAAPAISSPVATRAEVSSPSAPNSEASKVSPPKSSEKSGAVKAAMPSNTATTNKGLMIFVDPVTGQMREPTPEELKTLTDANAPSANGRQAVRPGSENIQGVDGSPGMTLGPDSMTYSVVTKTPEGLKIQEVTGEKAAGQRVNGGKPEEAKRGE